MSCKRINPPEFEGLTIGGFEIELVGCEYSNIFSICKAGTKHNIICGNYLTPDGEWAICTKEAVFVDSRSAIEFAMRFAEGHDPQRALVLSNFDQHDQEED
jgi:hypothetical protein